MDFMYQILVINRQVQESIKIDGIASGEIKSRRNIGKMVVIPRSFCIRFHHQNLRYMVKFNSNHHFIIFVIIINLSILIPMVSKLSYMLIMS